MRQSLLDFLLLALLRSLLDELALGLFLDLCLRLLLLLWLRLLLGEACRQVAPLALLVPLLLPRPRRVSAFRCRQLLGQACLLLALAVDPGDDDFVLVRALSHLRLGAALRVRRLLLLVVAVDAALDLQLDGADRVGRQLDLVLAVQEVVLQLQCHRLGRVLQQVERELDVGLAPLHDDLNPEEEDVLARRLRRRRRD